VETPYLSRKGTRAARRADGGAGLGCRKKRMPSCNEADTGFNVTRHESEPTSDGLSLQENRQKRLEKGEGKVRRWRSQTPVHSRLGERIGTPLSGARSSPESDGCRCVLRRLFARSAGVRSPSNAHLSALCPQGSGRCEGLFQIQGSERRALTRSSGKRHGRGCKRLGRSGGGVTNLSLSAGSTSPRGTASVDLWESRR
jgi:hypothetical protein